MDNETRFRRQVGQRIEKAMTEQRMDVNRLAARSGIPVEQLKVYLGGFRRISLERSAAIADALGVSLDWLAGREKPAVSPAAES